MGTTHTTGKKSFYDRPHDQYPVLDILNGERPQVTDDTPEFYAELMKKCWDHSPENRPTAYEIRNCISGYKYNSTEEKRKIISSAEAKRQEIIKSEKFLSDVKDYKHHPESFYTSRLLNKSIERAESSNLSSTKITSMITKDND